MRDYVDETKNDPKDLKAVAEWSDVKVKPAKLEIPIYSGQITVLINRGSGSASEMAASALRETRDAYIIGEKSAGQVLVSVLGKVARGFEIQYPITDYITIKGKRLEGSGVQPDLEALDPKFFRPEVMDDPLQKAIAISHRFQLRQERFPSGIGLMP